MSRFEACYPLTHRWERGTVNHPDDPGGLTKDGLTQAVYDGYRRRWRLPQQSVREAAPTEIKAIFKSQYWDVMRCDALPPGIDLVVFDFGINSGPGRAIRYLQAALGLKQDGVIGNITLAAAREAYERDDDDDVIDAYMASRNAFLRALKTFRVFGKGWMNRTRDIEREAERMEKLEDTARAFARVNKADDDMRGARVPVAKDKPPVIYAPDKRARPVEPRDGASVQTGQQQGGLAGFLASGATVLLSQIEAVKALIPDGTAPVIAGVVLLAAAGWLGWAAWQNYNKPADEARA
jgi:lysozyme family protein